MRNITIIGDCHGKYAKYVKVCKEAELSGNYTLQLGDMGFSYNHFAENNLSDEQHFFFPGNHDNYDIVENCPNYIGDFGPIKLPDAKLFFFIRGAYSIDKEYRTTGVDWWENEELSFKDWKECFELYGDEKPEIVITHDCPDIMRNYMTKKLYGEYGYSVNTKTGNMLEALRKIHEPAIHIFGHWHKDIQFTIGKTKFICLDELSKYII